MTLAKKGNSRISVTSEAFGCFIMAYIVFLTSS